MRSHLRARQVQIALQEIEDASWQFVAPFILLGVGPGAIESNGVVDIFGKRLPICAVPHEYVADPAAGGKVVDSPAGAPVSV